MGLTTATRTANGDRVSSSHKSRWCSEFCHWVWPFILRSYVPHVPFILLLVSPPVNFFAAHNKFIQFFFFFCTGPQCHSAHTHAYLQQQFEICMAFFARQLHYVPSMKSFHNLSHWMAYNLDVRIPSAWNKKKRKKCRFRCDSTNLLYKMSMMACT